MQDTVKWGHTTIHYRYKFKDRKTLAIHVHPDLSVQVEAPLETNIEKIREKVKKRASWIKKTKRDFELYLPKQPDRQYISGESHRYLGRQYRLKIRNGNENTVKCYRGYFNVTHINDSSRKNIQELLDHWYTEKAKNIFAIRYDKCCDKVKYIGIRPAQFSIRKLKTRWGSCTKSGRIILNLELIKAPTECIDYVILHELCHLKEHNHSQKFWKLLGKVLPDYEKRKRRLNQCADI